MACLIILDLTFFDSKMFVFDVFQSISSSLFRIFKKKRIFVSIPSIILCLRGVSGIIFLSFLL